MGGVLGRNSPLCPEPLDMPSLAFTVPFCDCEAMVQEARTVLRAFPRRADDPRQACQLVRVSGCTCTGRGSVGGNAGSGPQLGADQCLVMEGGPAGAAGQC